MSRNQHAVRLTSAQRAELHTLLPGGAAAALVQRRARILLQSDVARGGPRLTDADVAAAVMVTPRTLARVRAQFVTPLDRRRLDGASSHGVEFALVLDAIRDGTRPPANVGDIRPTFELLTAIYKSSQTGQLVQHGSIVEGDRFYDHVGGYHALKP